MPWQSGDFQKLPEVIRRNYDNQTVVLDGISYQNCTFNHCNLVFRGGPTKMVSCAIGAGTTWQFEDAAAFVLQFLSETGWKIAPPDDLNPLQNHK